MWLVIIAVCLSDLAYLLFSIATLKPWSDFSSLLAWVFGIIMIAIAIIMFKGKPKDKGKEGAAQLEDDERINERQVKE